MGLSRTSTQAPSAWANLKLFPLGFRYKLHTSEVTAGLTAANVSFGFEVGNVLRYGADPTGVADSRAAIQTAINVCAVAGGRVYIPAGKYLINKVAVAQTDAATLGYTNGLVVPYTNWQNYAKQITIEGEGQNSVLLAGSTAMVILRLSDAHATIDNLAFDANGQATGNGLFVGASDITNVALAEFVDWNRFTRLSIYGFTEGVQFESPSAGGTYYNRFWSCRFYNNTRHVNIRDNATAGGANRNNFTACSFAGGNVGIYIDGTDTTQIIGCGFEGIAVGVTPLANPSALYWNNVGTKRGLGSVDTQVVGCVFESNVRDANINNRRASIIGGNCGAAASIDGTATPDIWLGGDHAEIVRNLAMGNTGADGLYVSQRDVLGSCSRVITSTNSAQPFPYNNDGSLILQSRQQLASGIAMLIGGSSAKGMTLVGNNVSLLGGMSLVENINAQAYSASITIDASLGNIVEIQANNNTAFTINAPANPVAGQELEIIIYNTSAGALGAITWNAIFKMTGFVAPASGFNSSVRFYYGGPTPAWRQIGGINSVGT